MASLSNTEIARRLELIATLYTMTGDKQGKYKAASFNKAAESLFGNPNTDAYTDLPGIGKSIFSDILQLKATGTCNRLQNLSDSIGFPATALELLKLRGVGPKGMKALVDKGITSIKKLRRFLKNDPTTFKVLGEALKEYDAIDHERLPLWVVRPVAIRLLKKVKAVKGVKSAKVVGSIRRWRYTVRDVDIVCCAKAKDHSRISKWFCHLGKTLAIGDNKSRIIVETRSGPIQVDLVMCEPASYGASLHYLTGSKEHNIAMRKLALKFGLKLNEHGLWRGKKRVAGKTERGIFSKLGLPYHPPETRTEILHHTLPTLLKSKDLVGDYHTHTSWSDGTATAEAMIKAAINVGLDSIAIADHAYRIKDWKAYIGELKALREKYKGSIKVLISVESDVNKDGDLNVPIAVKGLDFIIASIHTKHKERPVNRLCAALKDPRVKVIGHPTGRQLGAGRPIPHGALWWKLFKQCAKRGVALEINAVADRMDLPHNLVMEAKKLGCRFVINSDAHDIKGVGNLRYGLKVARKALLTKKDLWTP